MGQQQLLLLVLGVIVVALATTLGIRAYERAQAQNAEQMMMQTATGIAYDAKTWATLDVEYGGGNSGPGREGYGGLSFDALHMPVGPSGFYEDRQGFWDLRPDRGELVIEGVSPDQGICVTLTVRGVGRQRIERDVERSCDRTRPGSGASGGSGEEISSGAEG